MPHMKEHFIEHYYNGKRNFPYSIGIWWKRVTGNIPVSDTPTYSYDVLDIINPQPRSHGIVAYSLWGDANTERFQTGLLEPLLNNAQQLKSRLPEWAGRIYISESIPSHIRQQLADSGYELFIMPDTSLGEGYVWRFLAATEHKPVIIHDADMKFINRELTPDIFTTVQEWLNTDKPFLRRQLHASNILNITPIRAGCWGVRPTKDGRVPLANIKETMKKYVFEGFGTDEAFLTKEVWPIMKKEGYHSTGGKNIALIVILSVLILLGLIILGLYLWKRRRRRRRRRL